MSVNTSLVKSIKANFAGVPSVELRQMLDQHDLSRCSKEALVAAEDVLNERARGQVEEPVQKEPEPEPELSPDQLRALADARLRRQIRIIGLWYYGFAGAWLVVAVLYALLQQAAVIPALVLFVPVLLLWLLGLHLRRFSPGRVVALVLSLLSLLNFPFGTLFGWYCFDKLTRGEHLFGGPGHPGEQGPEQARQA